MVNIFASILCTYISLTIGWKIPPANFLLDFSSFYHRKSICIYISHISTTQVMNWHKASIQNKLSVEVNNIAYVFQNMATNISSVPILNDDLHVFIPDETDLVQSFNIFIHLYSLRKQWNYEYWLLDVSNLISINNHINYLKNLKLDLDDNLFLYYISHQKNSDDTLISIWEFYEIHSTLPRKLNSYGTWNSINGLNVTSDDKWKRRHNLEGILFNTVALSAKPYITKLEPIEGRNAEYEFEGWFPEVWFELQDILNFTYKLNISPDGQWGSLKGNGTWTGMVNELHQKRVDIAPVPFSVTLVRSQAISYTIPLAQIHFQLFIKNPETTINYHAYSEPLHYITWLLIGIFCILMPPILVATTHYGEKDPDYKEFRLGKCITYTLGCLTVRGWSVTPTTNAARVAFVIIMIFGLLLNIAWNANLISYLATSKINLPFDSIATLLSLTNYQIAINPGTSLEDTFKLSTDSTYQKAWSERIEPYLEYYRPYAAEKRMIAIPLENPSIALYANYFIIEATDEFAKCEVLAIPTKMDSRSYAWGFQKYSPYLPLFNYYLKKMNEKGSIRKLYNKFKPLPQVCPDGAGKPIGFQNCLTAFIAFGAGLIVGLIFLFLEYLLDKLQNNKNPNRLMQHRDEEEIVQLIMDNFQGIQDHTEKLLTDKKRNSHEDSIVNFYDKLNLLRQDFISIKDII